MVIDDTWLPGVIEAQPVAAKSQPANDEVARFNADMVALGEADG